MKIITLSENRAEETSGGLLAEFGLSILIEMDECKVLFDTGQKISAVYNAAILGVDLSDIDKIVLSHGHFDHTGGLKSVLEQTGEIEVIAHPDVFSEKYATKQKTKPIGIPYSKELLEELGARFKLTENPTEIGNATVTGQIERTNDFEQIDRDLYVQKGDDLCRDDVLDEQGIVLKTDEGLFVILGCSHRGMINTIEQAKKITGEDRIYGVVGGTHLISADIIQIEKTIQALRKYDIKKIGVSHCMGILAEAKLSTEFGDRFFLNIAGSVIEF